MDDYESRKSSERGRDILSAWLLVAAIFFGLFAFSMIYEALSNGPEAIAGMQVPVAIGEGYVSHQDLSGELPIEVSR